MVQNSAPGPSGKEYGASTPGEPGRPVRILYVEDHRDTSKVVRILLERRGYTVLTASTVAGAVEIAQDNELDLLICDIGLPDGTGLDLMGRLENRRPPKAIVLSGYGMRQDIEKSLEVGFAEHLTKPVSQKTLLETIRRLTTR